MESALLLYVTLALMGAGALMAFLGQVTDRAWAARTRAERRGEDAHQWDGAGRYGWQYNVRVIGGALFVLGAVLSVVLAYSFPDGIPLS